MKNEIRIYENYAGIVLYDKYKKEKEEALIDLKDVEICSKYRWFVDNDRNYVSTYVKNQKIRLHNLLNNLEENQFVDHIDRNPLNNRRINMRICNKSENQMNRGVPKNNTSGIIGVVWNKRLNKWNSRIKINKKQIDLGLFDNKEEAIRVRKEAEKKYFGEFTPK